MLMKEIRSRKYLTRLLGYAVLATSFRLVMDKDWVGTSGVGFTQLANSEAWFSNGADQTAELTMPQ